MQLTRKGGFMAPTSVTPDGAALVVGSGAAAGMVAEDIGLVDTAGKSETRMLLDAEFAVLNPAVSPDGRWLAYESNESGVPQIFVRPFQGLDSGRWQVSGGVFGTRPLWSPDGREIFYLDANDFLTSVPVERTEAALSFGRPEVVIGKAYVNARAGRTYDVSPDGKRFLMIKAVTEQQDNAVGRVVMVQNWLDELRRVAPPRRSATR
jgi:serine/threonine-protein kinase